jgi:hypothetical protein
MLTCNQITPKRCASLCYHGTKNGSATRQRTAGIHARSSGTGEGQGDGCMIACTPQPAGAAPAGKSSSSTPSNKLTVSDAPHSIAAPLLPLIASFMQEIAASGCFEACFSSSSLPVVLDPLRDLTPRRSRSLPGSPQARSRRSHNAPATPQSARAGALEHKEHETKTHHGACTSDAVLLQALLDKVGVCATGRCGLQQCLWLQQRRPACYPHPLPNLPAWLST